MNIRTDLAFEAREIFMETANAEIPDGVEYTEEEKNGFQIRRVKIVSEQGKRALEKEIGTYITIHLPDIEYSDNESGAMETVADEISSLIQTDDNSSVFIVGLGNRNITADALGPKVMNGLVISRHIKEHMPELAQGLCRVCAISPGVLGITWIETGEIVMGIAEKIKPTHIIAIDALASKGIERIANTIQISDAGIVPGSGVGNHRKALTKETLGVPVISIGVPTVVSVGAIVEEITEKLAKKNTASQKKQQPAQELNQDLVVTPKNIDLIIDKVAKIISHGINLSLHKNFSLEELEIFL